MSKEIKLEVCISFNTWANANQMIESLEAVGLVVVSRMKDLITGVYKTENLEDHNKMIDFVLRFKGNGLVFVRQIIETYDKQFCFKMPEFTHFVHECNPERELKNVCDKSGYELVTPLKDRVYDMVGIIMDGDGGFHSVVVDWMKTGHREYQDFMIYDSTVKE